MQSKPLNEASDSSAPLDFIQSIHKMSTAWFEGVHPAATKDEKLEAFDDIHCMTLERFNKLYKETNGLLEYRYVVLDKWTVDIKLRLKILTDEPDNTDMHCIVIRGTTHFRARRSKD